MNKDADAQISLGRNFLSVNSFRKFLKEERRIPGVDYRKLNSDTDRCLTGITTLEVAVKSVCDNGLAECHFFGRGPYIESLYVPADCLKVIKPVCDKVSVASMNERDFLASV